MNNAHAASDHDIFQVIKRLNLPNDKYVIVGSGVLVALGLREWDGDVDLAVSNDIFEHFKQQGWHQEQEAEKVVLKHGDYDMGVAFGKWDLDGLLADALVINEIPFINLEKLLEWKRQANRPKDQHHIQLIENYLKTHQ
jgi:predicted nucleotidyltransferase